MEPTKKEDEEDDSDRVNQSSPNKVQNEGGDDQNVNEVGQKNETQAQRIARLPQWPKNEIGGQRKQRSKHH